MNDYFLAFYRPSVAFRRLLARENYIGIGFAYILIPILGYTLMYIFLTIGKGAPSVFTPWLNISKEHYYSINRFLLAPSMLLGWFATTSYIQILSRLSGGKGTFEQTLAMIALSIGVAMWGGLIHDLPMSFCSAVGIIDARQHEIDMNSPTIFRTLLWTAYAIYFTAFFILFPLAVRVVHGLKWGRSVAIGLSGFVLFQLIFLVFNR